MATYTIETSDAQDRAITWLVERMNENQSPSITVEEFVQAKALAALSDAETLFKQQARELVPRRFAAADERTQLQILSLLGLAPSA
jgi:hypothetical protein